MSELPEVKHTQEPWSFFKTLHSSFAIEAEGEDKIICHTGASDTDQANARRIAACVNACRSISTEMLMLGNPEVLKNVIERDCQLRTALIERESLRQRLEGSEKDAARWRQVVHQKKFDALGLRVVLVEHDRICGTYRRLSEHESEKLVDAAIAAEGAKENHNG